MDPLYPLSLVCWSVLHALLFIIILSCKSLHFPIYLSLYARGRQVLKAQGDEGASPPVTSTQTQCKMAVPDLEADPEAPPVPGPVCPPSPPPIA